MYATPCCGGNRSSSTERHNGRARGARGSENRWYGIAVVQVRVDRLGQLSKADVEFGDLTVLVGPQATGKSLLLQTLKLGIDHFAIRQTLRENGLDPRGDWTAFLDLYFGRGMRSLWHPDAVVAVGGMEVGSSLLRKRTGSEQHKVVYIPAQRTLALPDGFPVTFRQLGEDTPFVVRQYSELLRDALVNGRFDKDGKLFPNTGRLTKKLRTELDNAIFHGAELRFEQEQTRKDLRLKVDGSELPIMAWTAGQREVVPLLLATYSLIKAGAASKDTDVDWVIIEEPEMGLHPHAIIVVMGLVIELVARGYRVAISTHHPLVLDVVWAMNHVADHSAGATRPLAGFFGLSEKRVAAALKKSRRVHALGYEDGRATSTDISRLDPTADIGRERDWGGLTGFSSSLLDIVSAVSA